MRATAQVRPLRVAGAPGAKPLAVRPRPAGIFALAWPSLLENLLLLAMNMASLMMVGRLGSAAMAGIGIANQVAMLLQVVFMGLSVRQRLPGGPLGRGGKRIDSP